MQITLNQAEIELAIREFVNKRVAIAEDISVAIDLKATRGDAGFTAHIDLTDSANGTSSQEVRPLQIAEKVRQSRVTGGTVTGKAALAVPTATGEPLQAAQDAAQEATSTQPSERTTEATTPPSDATSDDAEEAEATEATRTPDKTGEPVETAELGPDVPPPAEKPKSLFANLSKPRNTN